MDGLIADMQYSHFMSLRQSTAEEPLCLVFCFFQEPIKVGQKPSILLIQLVMMCVTAAPSWE